MATLKAPEGSADTISFEGIEFQVHDGIVDVPEEAVGTLLSHGFTVHELQADPEVVQAEFEEKRASRRKAKADADQAGAE